MKKIKKYVKKIKIKDIKDIFLILILSPIGIIYRAIFPPIWIVTERECECRDNGYWFFKYLRENHNYKKVYYIINTKCRDYNKIKLLGNIIEYGSLKHYIYYMCCTLDISAHIGSSSPNYKITKILENTKILGMKKVFLQHGVIKDYIGWCTKDKTKIDLFCVSSENEKKFVEDSLGYNREDVIITGLCRFDNLKKNKNEKIVLFMPTWRQWLKYDEDRTYEENQSVFKESNYFKKISQLIENEKLIKFLEINDIKMLFYPHFEMQKYIHNFIAKTERIVICDKDNYDVQSLLKKSKILITDYSSIFFDFAYMDKPLIYYQFDYDEFKEMHYSEGYFSYRKNGFGQVVTNENKLIDLLHLIINRDFKLDEKYMRRKNKFFYYKDFNNCERVYNSIIKKYENKNRGNYEK